MEYIHPSETIPLFRKEMLEKDVVKLKMFFYKVWLKVTAEGEWKVTVPELGQSAVTALVLQDHFGGEILRCLIDRRKYHYWNMFPNGQEIDLTRSQFDHIEDKPDFATKKETERWRIEADLNTRERYEYLSEMVDAYLKLDGMGNLQELFTEE